MNLVFSSQGGFGYSELRAMRIPELQMLHREAIRIKQELEQG